MSNPVSPYDERSVSSVVKYKNYKTVEELDDEQNTQGVAQKILTTTAMLPTSTPSGRQIQYVIAPTNFYAINAQELSVFQKPTAKRQEAERIDDLDLPLPLLRLQLLSKVTDDRATSATKIEFLKTLYEIIESDPRTVDSSEKLLIFTSQLAELMIPARLQMETIPVQIHIAKLFSAVASLLTDQQYRKHIGGVTGELKDSIKKTIEGGKVLNLIESTELSYYLEIALEAIIRLKDDKPELANSIRKGAHSSFHLTMAGASYYFNGINTTDELKKIWKDIKSIQFNPKSAWYDYSMLLELISTVAKNDIRYLLLLQEYVEEKCSKLDWRLLYTATKLIHDIAMYGKTDTIRKMAFEGNPLTNNPSPGLLALTCYDKYSKSVDLSRTTHYGMPQMVSPNTFIQINAIKYLISFAKNAPDSALRAEANKFILERFDNEKNGEILLLLDEYLTNRPREDAWTDNIHGLHNTKKKMEKREKRMSAPARDNRTKKKFSKTPKPTLT